MAPRAKVEMARQWVAHGARPRSDHSSGSRQRFLGESSRHAEHGPSRTSIPHSFVLLASLQARWLLV